MKELGRILAFGGLGFLITRMIILQLWFELGVCLVVFIGIFLYAFGLADEWS